MGGAAGAAQSVGHPHGDISDKALGGVAGIMCCCSSVCTLNGCLVDSAAGMFCFLWAWLCLLGSVICIGQHAAYAQQRPRALPVLQMLYPLLC